MKDLKSVLATSVALLALSNVAMASEVSYEYYAHPTLFSTSSQVTVDACLKSDKAYVVGEKKVVSEDQVSITGKEKVLVDSWTKDVILPIQFPFFRKLRFLHGFRYE